jgi:hypothetical protein
MTRKIITGVIAVVLVITIVVLAAEKAKEKARACEQSALSKVEGFGLHERLLDQLVEAYKANDREKMGEIINRMQERREKMREFVRFNRWQRWAHRRMMGLGFAPNYGAMQGRQMGPGWGQDQQMAGQGWNRGWAMRGQGWNQGCSMAAPQWGQFQAMNGCCQGPCGGGMGNCGPMPGGFGQMPGQQGGMGMGAWGQPYGQRMPMRGWERGGFRKEWTPGPGADNMWQQEWNMPRHERQNVPPPEWGW